MTLGIYDRVKDTTATVGAGTITLSGIAPIGYRSFGSVLATGDTCWYCIASGSEWEVGVGTYNSTGPTLARTTILSSSNAGMVVTFSAGIKDVILTNPASITASILGTVSGLGTLATLNAAPAGTLTGTLLDATLSSNVPLKNAANTFTAGQTVTASNANYNPALWVSDSNNTLGAALYFEYRGGAVGNKVHALIADGYGLTIYRMNDGGGSFLSTIPSLCLTSTGRVYVSDVPGGIGSGTLRVKCVVADESGIAIQGLTSQSGSLLELWGVSSTAANRVQAAFSTAWSTSTDATRQASVSLSAYGIVASVETKQTGLTVTASNSGNPIVSLTGGNASLYAASGYIGTLDLGQNNASIYIRLLGNYGLKQASSFLLAWSSTGAATGAIDLALGRNAAGVVEINNGTAGVLGGLKASSTLVADGTAALPSYGFTSEAGIGMSKLTTGILGFYVSGARVFDIRTGGACYIPSDAGGLMIGSGGDTSLKRSAAGTMAVGHGSFPATAFGQLNASTINLPALSTPTITSVTTFGTTGATSYTYKVAKADASFKEGIASAAVTIATGNATLSVTNYNIITMPALSSDMARYNVYRTASGGSPATLGFIGSFNNGTTFNDTGLAADGTTAPAINATGVATIGGLTIGKSDGTNSFIQPASGKLFLNSFSHIIFNTGFGTGSSPEAAFISSSGFRMRGTYVYGWANAGNVEGSVDTGLGRNAAGVVEVNSGTAGSYAGTAFKTGPQTVAQLPAAATAGAGARAFVTDATATTFLSTVAGGGANMVPVVSDGAVWMIG